MKKAKKHEPKGHKPQLRDLVSIRGDAKKMDDLLPSKRRNRLNKLYGYKP